MSIDSDELDRGIEGAYTKHDIAAITEGIPLAALLEKNPDEGIKQIRKAYDSGLDYAYTSNGKNNRAFVEAIAGGPHEAVPAAVYNVVGKVYPRLTKEQKYAALEKIIGIMDGFNSEDVQTSHTSNIHEPLLLSDIVIARWIYWPGLYEGKQLIKKYGEYSRFEKEMMDESGLFKDGSVRSEFLTAVALLRSDMCNWGEDYACSANPLFLERVLKGIVGMRFAVPNKLRGYSDEQGVARLKELLPANVHERLEPLKQEHDWAEWEEVQELGMLSYYESKYNMKFNRLDRLRAEEKARRSDRSTGAVIY